MIERKRFLLGLLVTLSVTAGLLTYVSLGGTGAGLAWGVSVGDESEWFLDIVPFEYGVPPSSVVEALDNMTVRVKIEYLPSLTWLGFVTSDNFASAILEPVKVSVTAVGNRTIDDTYASVLVKLFSVSVLPTGNWPLLDSLYGDEEPSYHAEEEYMMWDELDWFRLMYQLPEPLSGINYYIHLYRGWIDRSTGLPIAVEYTHVGYGCGLWTPQPPWTARLVPLAV